MPCAPLPTDHRWHLHGACTFGGGAGTGGACTLGDGDDTAGSDGMRPAAPSAKTGAPVLSEYAQEAGGAGTAPPAWLADPAGPRPRGVSGPCCPSGCVSGIAGVRDIFRCAERKCCCSMTELCCSVSAMLQETLLLSQHGMIHCVLAVMTCAPSLVLAVGYNHTARVLRSGVET